MESLIGRKIQDNDPRYPNRVGEIVGYGRNGCENPMAAELVRVRWNTTGRETLVKRAMIGKTCKRGYRFEMSAESASELRAEDVAAAVAMVTNARVAALCGEVDEEIMGSGSTEKTVGDAVKILTPNEIGLGVDFNGEKITFGESIIAGREILLEAGGSSKPNVESVLIPVSEFKALNERWENERARADLNGEALTMVRSELDAAIAERDARILDEALRAQRVDVEALRHKVCEMKKNLAAVDARADERFVVQMREKEAACDRRVAMVLETERVNNLANFEKANSAVAELEAVRAGEAARVTAINTAMDAIWAYDKREPGCAYSLANLVANLRQILSVGRIPPQ
jgi:hypothetical protein